MVLRSRTIRLPPDGALSRPAAKRDSFLVDACADDEELLREVGSLLMFHEGGNTSGADPAAEKDEFSAGDMFAGRYRMIARVGRGGMGDVWRADDLILETPVALKLIRSASPPARIRILQEVRLARQITHSAVCRVVDVGEAGEAGEAGDTIFFSMDFVQGEDLAALLKRTGRLTSERVLEIARQLCAGLAAAHAQGVLHRDLKPANVLIDYEVCNSWCDALALERGQRARSGPHGPAQSAIRCATPITSRWAKMTDRECPQACAKGGAPYVLVSDGKLDQLTTHDADLQTHAGHTVNLTGELKGDTIRISEIEIRSRRQSSRHNREPEDRPPAHFLANTGP